ncbi:unnamed protein product [Orchesella dallaii]|uniref:N-acetyltransferase domain-containing protein n=1 Tax=Orchesella dallaii TaxID=48710 RepID=A0ABP1QFT8_9HEXA
MNNTTSMTNTRWKEFTFKVIEPSDYSAVFRHLKGSFYIEEPVNKALGFSPEREQDLNVRKIDMFNRYSKSLAVCPLEEPDRIVAVLITNIHDVNTPMPFFEPRSPITTKYRHVLEQMEKAFNIHETYGVPRFPELAILSVDKEFRGKGIATELYKRAISQLFLEGFPLVYSEFSNPISRLVGERLGFKEVSRFYFKDLTLPDISCAFDNVENDDFVTLTVLENPEHK